MKFFLLKGTLFVILLSVAVFARDVAKDKKNIVAGSSLDQISRTYLDINNISTQFYNNGIGDIDPSNKAGLIYPKGSGKNAAFTSGLLWGGMVVGDPTPIVGGTAYRTGLQPGNILASGSAAPNPLTDPKFRIYRVRPDVNPTNQADLTADAFNENSNVNAVKAQYLLDWNEWPAYLGAPFKDINGNGTYEPNIDIPGVPGADQTIWFVANDMDPTQTSFLYGAPPIGIEIQTTYWAYKQDGALGNMFFRKNKLINKGSQHNTVNNMYLSMWADVDLGNATDDLVGVDTVLSLQYCYNSSTVDADYNPLPPPCTGFDFFQGPLVKGVAGQDLNNNGIDDSQDYGIFNGKKAGPGKINLPMTAAYYFANGDPNIGDPPQGDRQGSVQFYNFFRGLYGISGAPFIDPSTSHLTTFALNGDPIKQTGWYDGLQLPAGDRRQGMASGPFTFAPGDTQEVVVAEMVAGAIQGVDRLSAISILKYYDLGSQFAYDIFFNVPMAPPLPLVKKAELDKEIVLDWGENPDAASLAENYSSYGYAFQGYNVYQLPSASSTIEQGVRIAAFDKVDGVLKILDWVFDPSVGAPEYKVKQFGSDYGIRRYIDINYDWVNASPLVNGNNYYFAVTSYSYNPGSNVVPNNLEDPIQIITASPQSVNPDLVHTGSFSKVDHNGLADGEVSVKIVDPTSIKDSTYQIFFTQRQEIRNSNGDWIPANVKKINSNGGMHPDTLTGSSIDMSALYGPQSGIIDLKCTININSVDTDFADGLRVVLPANVFIISSSMPTSLNTGNPISPVISGHTIFYGDTTHPYTGNGVFVGGETFDILVQGNLPITSNWKIFDDGFGHGPIDVSGTTSVTTIGDFSRTAKYWNVKNSSTNVIKIANQGIINGVDLFPKRDDIITKIGIDASPFVEGVQINLNVAYEPPINYFKSSLVRGPGSTTTLTHYASASSNSIDLLNYTIFGTVSSKAKDIYGFGSTDINILQKDYILKFSGIWDSTDQIAGHIGQMVHFIKPGTGSWATIFSPGNVSSNLGPHPLNPSPGVNKPFLVRVPFEVWSKDDNRQVNLMFRDRMQTGTENPFWVWNLSNRMYAILVNSNYDSINAIPASVDPLNANATWGLVFYGTHYSPGDIVEVDYANPIQFGIDNYTYTPTVVTGIKDNNPIPLNFNLSQNYPNPFNPSTYIRYSIPRAGLVTLKIYDVLGREIKTLLNEYKNPGNYTVNFAPHGLTSGVYFYRLSMGNYSDVKKLVFLK